uniref:Uncharacterized protein n=1 Tax=Brassica campestris TaxID=3711 RepID=A0A3P5YCT1_BRACM|nr:unnamed protein product [Brassica rapa]
MCSTDHGKQDLSVSSEDGSSQKPEKPLPNYLKPTISSRHDLVKFLKKNNTKIALDTASLSSAQVDEEEILKVESGVQVVDGIEESRVKENKEVHVEALHGDESVDEDETSEKLDIDMNSKEVESVEEATEAKEEVNKEENVNVKDEEKEKVKEEEESGDG